MRILRCPWTGYFPCIGAGWHFWQCISRNPFSRNSFSSPNCRLRRGFQTAEALQEVDPGFQGSLVPSAPHPCSPPSGRRRGKPRGSRRPQRGRGWGRARPWRPGPAPPVAGGSWRPCPALLHPPRLLPTTPCPEARSAPGLHPPSPPLISVLAARVGSSFLNLFIYLNRVHFIYLFFNF